MRTEYPVWGIAPGKKKEELLFSKAMTLGEAKQAKKLLETKYGCKKCRIQTLKFDGKIF